MLKLKTTVICHCVFLLCRAFRLRTIQSLACFRCQFWHVKSSTLAASSWVRLLPVGHWMQCIRNLMRLTFQVSNAHTVTPVHQPVIPLIWRHDWCKFLCIMMLLMMPSRWSNQCTKRFLYQHSDCGENECRSLCWFSNAKLVMHEQRQHPLTSHCAGQFGLVDDWRFLIKQIFTAHMPLLTVTVTFVFGRRCNDVIHTASDSAILVVHEFLGRLFDIVDLIKLVSNVRPSVCTCLRMSFRPQKVSSISVKFGM